jgi:hypothetical protein
MTPREIDALIASRVMGLYLHKRREEWDDGDPYFYVYYKEDSEHIEHIPHYSTSIASAWDVVEKLQSLGKTLILTWDARELKNSYFISNFNSEGLPCRGWKFEDDSFEIEADTAPMAICLAALEAVKDQ